MTHLQPVPSVILRLDGIDHPAQSKPPVSETYVSAWVRTAHLKDWRRVYFALDDYCRPPSPMTQELARMAAFIGRSKDKG